MLEYQFLIDGQNGIREQERIIEKQQEEIEKQQEEMRDLKNIVSNLENRFTGIELSINGDYMGDYPNYFCRECNLNFLVEDKIDKNVKCPKCKKVAELDRMFLYAVIRRSRREW